jgi:hypothetical protein
MKSLKRWSRDSVILHHEITSNQLATSIKTPFMAVVICIFTDILYEYREGYRSFFLSSSYSMKCFRKWDYCAISCFVLRYRENAFFTISEKVG